MKYIFHPVRTVTALDNYMLFVEFCEGVSKIYDIKPLFERISIFNELKENNLFMYGQVDTGGYGVVWDEKIDLSADEIWEKGKTIKTSFDNLLSIGEATKMWNLENSTIRKAIARGKFINGIDTQKFGKQWVITKEAMEREYSKKK